MDRLMAPKFLKKYWKKHHTRTKFVEKKQNWDFIKAASNIRGEYSTVGVIENKKYNPITVGPNCTPQIHEISHTRAFNCRGREWKNQPKLSNTPVLKNETESIEDKRKQTKISFTRNKLPHESLIDDVLYHSNDESSVSSITRDGILRHPIQNEPTSKQSCHSSNNDSKNQLNNPDNVTEKWFPDVEIQPGADSENLEHAINRIQSTYGQNTTVDVDNLSFIIHNINGKKEMTIVANLLKEFMGYGNLTFYNHFPNGDGRKWSVRKPNEYMPHDIDIQEKEVLLTKYPFEIALLRTEAPKFFKNHFQKIAKFVTLEKYFTQKGYLIDASRTRNLPTVIDLCNSLIESEISYIHVCMSGQRWPVCSNNDYTAKIFQTLEDVRSFALFKDVSMKLWLCQIDVAINTNQDHLFPSKGSNRKYILPMWGRLCKYPSRKKLLGPSFSMKHYDAWNLHRGRNENKFGAIFFSWIGKSPSIRSDPNFGHRGQLSRGVHQIKCYVTNAHLSNNFKMMFPNTNGSFEFSTVKSAKKMLNEAYILLSMIHDPKNIGTYKHRCEIVWHPNQHIKTITLTQAVNLAFYVRKYHLSDCGVQPIPLNFLPESIEIQKRTIRVIYELTKFLQKRNSVYIHSRVLTDKQRIWFHAQVALLLSGLGFTGSHLYSIFHKWYDEKDPDEIYDPNLIHEFTFPNESVWDTMLFDNSFVDKNFNVVAENLPKYLAARKCFFQKANHVRTRHIHNYRKIIKRQNNFIKYMMKYETFQETSGTDTMPFITRFQLQNEYSDNSSDEELENEINLIMNFDRRKRQKMSSGEVFLEEYNIFIPNERNEDTNESELHQEVRWQSVEWWKGMKSNIISTYERKGLELDSDFHILFDYCLEEGKFSLKHLEKIARILNVRIHRSQRRKEQIIIRLQESFDYDLTRK